MDSEFIFEFKILNDNVLIHSFLHYYHILCFTNNPQILFGSDGNPLASTLLAIHAYRMPVSGLKYEFPCDFTDFFMMCIINSKQITFFDFRTKISTFFHFKNNDSQ